MSANVARLSSNREDLSEDDIRVATALIHSRFRGLFSGVSQNYSNESQLELVVWGPRMNELLFRVTRRDGRYVAVDENWKEIFSAYRLEELLTALRSLYPPMSAI